MVSIILMIFSVGLIVFAFVHMMQMNSNTAERIELQSRCIQIVRTMHNRITELEDENRDLKTQTKPKTEVEKINTDAVKIDRTDLLDIDE